MKVSVTRHRLPPGAITRGPRGDVCIIHVQLWNDRLTWWTQRNRINEARWYILMHTLHDDRVHFSHTRFHVEMESEDLETVNQVSSIQRIPKLNSTDMWVWIQNVSPWVSTKTMGINADSQSRQQRRDWIRVKQLREHPNSNSRNPIVNSECAMGAIVHISNIIT